MSNKQILGIDIGGSGIKGAPVDIEKGILLEERFRIPTPPEARPNEVADVVADVIHHFEWSGPVGVGFPAAIRDGIALTAANIHSSWIGTFIPALITDRTKCPARIINDADAAGLAEMTFGAGKGRMGNVIVITVGTGIGTAIFNNGHLYINSELGHIEINGKIAEKYASDATRKDKDLDWKSWAERFNIYLHKIERLLWPRLIIIGGGISQKHEKFFQYLDVRAEIVPAQLRNEAGIIGAALCAKDL